MSWKKLLADYFNFTRRDRIAVIVLILLISAVFLLPGMLSQNKPPKPTGADTAWVAAMKRLEQKDSSSNGPYRADDNNSMVYAYDRPAGTYTGKTKGELFYFDPNKLTSAEWKRLGLRNKTIATIQNFVTKGGRFRKPEDLQRIYGLFPDEYERLAPYIKIEADGKDGRSDFTRNDPTERSPANPFTPRYAPVNINNADTTALIALPGIGSKLAARIISFRDKLGGFYSINQVGETFGLADSVFQKIKQYLQLDAVDLRKININTSTIEELKAHPYIRYSIANPVIAYRNEHGLFTKTEDLKKVMAVTDAIYQKILPYLTVR